MDKEVFSSKDFAQYAKKNLVLVEADFPARKQLPEALKKANEQLKNKYQIQGFPTLVILDSQGKVLGKKVGYGGGGPKAVISEIEKFKKKA